MQEQLRVWSETLMEPDRLVSEAISCLERTALQIVLVVDSHRRLIGTICDGDIRRGILEGKRLDAKVTEVMNPRPVSLPITATDSEIRHVMQRDKVQQIPLVSKEKIVCGLRVWNNSASDVNESYFVIMAGGRGQRLRPLTDNCPKPMLEINGAPMLEKIIERAARSGFREFIISINYLGHMVEEYFGDGSDLGVSIRYIREEKPLGTAGCLSELTLNEITCKDFVVTNGDVITDVNYADVLEFHRRNHSNATMSVRPNRLQNPFGVVELDGIKIKRIDEKPIHHSLVNAGIYVLDKSILKLLIPDCYCDMTDFFSMLIKSQSYKVSAYPIHESWYDVGRPKDLDLVKGFNI